MFDRGKEILTQTEANPLRNPLPPLVKIPSGPNRSKAEKRQRIFSEGEVPGKTTGNPFVFGPTLGKNVRPR